MPHRPPCPDTNGLKYFMYCTQIRILICFARKGFTGWLLVAAGDWNRLGTVYLKIINIISSFFFFFFLLLSVVLVLMLTNLPLCSRSENTHSTRKTHTHSPRRPLGAEQQAHEARRGRGDGSARALAGQRAAAAAAGLDCAHDDAERVAEVELVYLNDDGGRSEEYQAGSASDRWMDGWPARGLCVCVCVCVRACVCGAAEAGVEGCRGGESAETKRDATRRAHQHHAAFRQPLLRQLGRQHELRHHAARGVLREGVVGVVLHDQRRVPEVALHAFQSALQSRRQRQKREERREGGALSRQRRGVRVGRSSACGAGVGAGGCEVGRRTRLCGDDGQMTDAYTV